MPRLLLFVPAISRDFNLTIDIRLLSFRLTLPHI